VIRRVEYPTREAWLADRRNFIGASEVASIIGAPGAYSSRWEIWARKCGKLPEKPESESMRWGSRLERSIALGVAEDHGGTVTPTDSRYCVGPEDKPHHRATPDAIWEVSGEELLLEIKNVDRMLGEHWDAGPPPHVVVQLQWQMYCAGFDRAAVAALVGGNRLHVYHVERDDELIDELVRAVDAFWCTVENRLEPMAEARDVELLPLRWQAFGGVVHELTLFDARRLVGAAAAVKDAQTAYNQAKAETMQAMGEATEGMIDGQAVVTWRENKAGSRVFRLTRNAADIVRG
jgi:putative phage-type endonuclease